MDVPVKHKKPSIAAQAAARTARFPKLPEHLLDGLVEGPMSAMEVEDLIDAFGKAVIERAMAGEMNAHLGYRAGEDKPAQQADERNGVSAKTLLTKHGSMRVQWPRDWDGTFEPVLIPKHERHFAGFDERIIALYARGMSVREIQAFLAETYGTDVSPELISEVTDEVMAETVAWQNRPLERMYPVVFFDALRVKIRTDRLVVNKAVYLALGIDADGERDVLGLWIEQIEGSKIWLTVFNELKNRGCQDILIAVVDGFSDLTAARRWVASFVHWYNDSHRHSDIRYVTPAQRHAGLDGEILRQRHQILTQAKARHPARWSRGVRNCQPIAEVWLNPERQTPVIHGQKELETA